MFLEKTYMNLVIKYIKFYLMLQENYFLQQNNVVLVLFLVKENNKVK